MTTTVTSSSSSPSNWLTRLRTSKGFPDSHHTDLEHFLSTSLPLSPPITPKPKPPPADVTSPHPLPSHDVISNVLSDLFCFGNPNNNTPSSKKASRKQVNPKQCVFAKNENLVVSGSPKVRSRTSRKQVRPKVFVAKNTQVRECGEEEVVEEEEWGDFSGFTETEVTVIDTSVASWKFEKVLYRRKNEWRVGEKRRRNGGEEDGEKTNKNKNKKLKLCGELKARDKENGEKTKKKMKKKKKLKFVNREGDVAGSKFVQGHDQGKEMVAASEKKQDNCSQVQEKRVLKKQIDGGSSVILIKSIPITNKKDMSGISKSCVKLQK